MITLSIKGAILLALWRADGERIPLPVEGRIREAAQTLRVTLPACEDGQDTLKVIVRQGDETKTFRLECTPDAYLEWEANKSPRRLLRR